MHCQNLQIRMAFEDAIEDQVMKRDRGFERVADHIVEIEALESSAVGEAVGMDHHERAQRLGLLPERRVFRLREFAPGDIGQDLRALHAERGHATLELARGFRPVDQRHGAEGDKAI